MSIVLIMFYKILYFTLCLVLSNHVTAELVKYNQLQVEDYDKMLQRVRELVKKSQKLLKKSTTEEPSEEDQKAIEPLREAILTILSRPNQDNMLGKLLPEVRKELVHLNAFEDNLTSVVAEAIEGLKNEKFNAVQRATYLIVIENFVSEFKPEIKDNEKDDLKQIFISIRDAKLQIPETIRKELKLRSMLRLESPSDRAERILKSLEPAPAKK